MFKAHDLVGNAQKNRQKIIRVLLREKQHRKNGWNRGLEEKRNDRRSQEKVKRKQIWNSRLRRNINKKRK